MSARTNSVLRTGIRLRPPRGLLLVAGTVALRDPGRATFAELVDVRETVLEVVEDQPHRRIRARGGGDQAAVAPDGEDAAVEGRRLELAQLGKPARERQRVRLV